MDCAETMRSSMWFIVSLSLSNLQIWVIPRSSFHYPSEIACRIEFGRVLSRNIGSWILIIFPSANWIATRLNLSATAGMKAFQISMNTALYFHFFAWIEEQHCFNKNLPLSPQPQSGCDCVRFSYPSLVLYLKQCELSV